MKQEQAIRKLIPEETGFIFCKRSMPYLDYTVFMLIYNFQPSTVYIKKIKCIFSQRNLSQDILWNRQCKYTCRPGAFPFFYHFKHSRRSSIKIVNIKQCKPHLLDVTASVIILCPEVYNQQLYKLRVTLQFIILHVQYRSKVS